MGLQRQASAVVKANRILLYSPYEGRFIARGIPGGFWNDEERAWSYPATSQIANLLLAKFGGLTYTDEFSLLLGDSPQRQTPAFLTAPAASEAPAEEPEIHNVRTRPWRHQKLAYAFVRRLWAAAKRGALLGMGMGTGKSFVTVALTCNLDNSLPVLVQCPLRVAPVWLTQFKAHAAADVKLRILVLGDDYGSVEKKQKAAAQCIEVARVRGERAIIVVNYESAWREPFATWSMRQRWGLIVLDECHKIKSNMGRSARYCSRLAMTAQYRLGLSGTFMPHSFMDIFSQYRFLDRSIFGKAIAPFRARYAVMGGFGGKEIVGLQNQEELNRKIYSICFRVGKEVLDLPPELHVEVPVRLSPEGMRVYRDLDRDFRAEVLGGEVTVSNAMVKLLRLQQVTSGWLKTDQGTEVEVDHAKCAALSDLFEDMGPDEPVVVFCRFHADLNAVHAAAKEQGFSSMELSGRRDDLAAWQQGQAQILAVQISAGGVGVDLTRARYSVFYSLSFSLGEYDQALCRVHRPGQTRPVTHYHMAAVGTVDVRIRRALEKRREVVEEILREIKSGTPVEAEEERQAA